MNSTLTRKENDVKSEIYAGVDLGMDENVVQVLDANGKKLDRFQFEHSEEGYNQFVLRLEKNREKHQVEGVLVGMEPTNYYWKLVASHLQNQPRMSYRLVNAYTVNKHRQGNQLDRSKDDARDAYQVGELLRMGKYTQTQLLSDPYARLREQARVYQRLQCDLGRQKTLLRTNVGQVFPELPRVFKDLTGQTIRALLEAQGCACEIRGMSADVFLQQVRAHFNGNRLFVSKLLKTYDLAKHSVGLCIGLEGLQQSIQIQLETIELLERQMARMRTALLETFYSLPVSHFWLSIPGLGDLTAALILAEIGDPADYQHVGQWIKLAGTQPTSNRSGRFSSSQTPMSAKGRSRLRTQLFLAILNIMRKAPAFRQRYQKLCTRPTDPLHKKQAMVVLINWLLRILWALYHHQVPYRAPLS